MSSESELWEKSLFGSASDGYGHCCPPVFDPYTLVALLGGVALATYFLRLVIVTQNFGRSFGSYSIYGEQTMNYDTNDMDLNCREFGSNIRPQLDDQYTGGIVGRIPRK